MVFHTLWHNKGHSYITDVLGTCRNFSPRQMLTIPGLLLFFEKKLSIVDLQRCVSFRYTAKWFSCVCVCVCVCVYTSVSQFSHSVVSDSLQPHGLQHARPPCPSPTPRVYSNSCPLSRWCHAMQPSHPLLSPSPPVFNPSQHQGLFKWVRSASGGQLLEFQLPHQSFQWIPRADLL